MLHADFIFAMYGSENIIIIYNFLSFAKEIRQIDKLQYFNNTLGMNNFFHVSKSLVLHKIYVYCYTIRQ